MPDPIQGVNSGLPVGVANTGQAGATQSADQPAAASSAAVAPTDAADVGQTEALLAQILQAANAAPATDDAKVEALQQSIANGTYQVDPMAIAKRLMNLDSGSGQDDE